ncbi:hypothetical protein F511_21844 [Dorcoceras hygrometricum]|uniref:Uncharacterized protein n=1 Tax=Dorcoceras hygrometricum TaxID=472368 RepID=A0A2Z7A392_9LAMI|nr:hypothetical protein F511_21844 [Dorcoceras hygrometricum]
MSVNSATAHIGSHIALTSTLFMVSTGFVGGQLFELVPVVARNPGNTAGRGFSPAGGAPGGNPGSTAGRGFNPAGGAPGESSKLIRWFVYGSSKLNLLRLPFFRNEKDPLEDFDYNDACCNPLLRPAAARNPSTNHRTLSPQAV